MDFLTKGQECDMEITARKKTREKNINPQRTKTCNSIR